MKKSMSKKTIITIIIASAIVLVAGIAIAIKTQIDDDRLGVASWGFGSYDQDWIDINCTFSDFYHAGYNGNKYIYKSKAQKTKEEEKAVWSRAGEEHKFGNYCISVSGNSMEFFYTRESGDKEDRDLVMKMNFSLYKKTHPSDKYQFQVRKYIKSGNNGKEESTGYITEVRNPVGGDPVPEKYQDSTLNGIKYIYPNLTFDFYSLSEAINSGTWIITLDNMQVYDD